MVAVGLAAPFIVYPVFAMNVLCLALFASAFNLLLGYSGLLSFGHAAFLGAGGYITLEAIKAWRLPIELAILAGTVAAVILGIIFGALAIRRSGIYFAMITLGFAQVIYFLVLRFWIIHRTIHSPFGHVLRAIRENEPRAISLGYDVDRHKLLAFVISAGLAGLAGSMKALVAQSATLSDVHWHRSGAVVLMTLLGGMGTTIGPSVGALLVAALENYLASYGSWIGVLTGSVFIVCVLAFRRGIVGEIRALVKRSF